MKTDVLIIGAGPAGTSLAYRLAAMGVQTTVLERETFPRDKTCGGGLTPRALRALARLEFPLTTLLARGRPYGGFRLFSPSGHETAIRYRPNGDTRPMLDTAGGVVIKRDWFDAALLERCAAAGARVLQRASAVRLLRSGTQVTGALARQNGGIEEIHSLVTVVATGAQVRLLREAGLQHPAERPPVTAVRMYVDGVESADDLLTIVYTSELAPGYLWAFPVSNTTANVGLGLESGAVAGHTMLPQALDAICRNNPPLRAAFSRAHPVGEQASWVLRCTFPHANTSSGGLVVVGEAAGLVDPLTGEGITFALESAELAAQVLAAALNKGLVDGGHLAAYDQALRWRYADYFETAYAIRHYAAQPELLDALFRLGSPLARLSGRLNGQTSATEERQGGQAGTWIPARPWLQVPRAMWLLWRMARLRRGRSQAEMRPLRDWESA